MLPLHPANKTILGDGLCGVPEQYERFFIAGLKARSVFHIHHHRPAADGAACPGHRGREFLPMQHVLRHEMHPGITPAHAVRLARRTQVMQVILALVVKHADRVIEPALGRGEV